jgi:hypothetical protein
MSYTGSMGSAGSAVRWRVGTKVPLNVYEADRPVCQCRREEDARRIVDAMNVFDAMSRWSGSVKAFDTPETVAAKAKAARELGDLVGSLRRTEKP